MTHLTRVFAWVEFSVIAVLALIADFQANREAVTPDELLILWCLIGGIGGSIVNLHFYPTRDRTEGCWQFVVNFICSGIFSPVLCDQVSYWCKLPIGLRLALPVSFCVGFFACVAITQGLPYVRRWYKAWWLHQIKSLSSQNIKVVNNDDEEDNGDSHDDAPRMRRVYHPPNPYRRLTKPEEPAGWDDMKGE